MSSSYFDKRKQLIESILPDGSNLVVIAGTGVSIQATGETGGGSVAGWKGLLLNGLEYCKQYDLLGSSHPEITKDQILTNETEHLIGAAQMISGWLAKSRRKQHWINESIGTLEPRNSDLIYQIQRLGGLMATLNYDDVLHKVTKRSPLHWQNQEKIDEYIARGSFDYILHIHGYWREVDSLVLDQSSYDAFVKDEKMKQLMQRFARWHRMVFIGCSGTFADPHFVRLFRWCDDIIGSTLHRHFILCTAAEREGLMKFCGPNGFLEPLVYGETHDELIPFVKTMADDLRLRRDGAGPFGLSKMPEIADDEMDIQKPISRWTGLKKLK